MSRPSAILWDVDGTLAETERDGHRVAFNMAFAACGLGWRWDEALYGQLLRVTGGYERLLQDMTTRADAPATAADREALARAIHERKNAFYAQLVRDGRISLRPGVLQLMQQCDSQGWRMAITTTTSRANVDALLGAHLGARWRERFAAVVCGEDVRAKKPHPEVFVRALAILGIGQNEAVAIEDSPIGAAAARAAGVPVLVTRSAYFEEDPIEGAVAVGPGLHDRRGWRPALTTGAEPGSAVELDDIRAWCRRAL